MPKYIRYSNIVTPKKYHQNTMERRSVTSRYHVTMVALFLDDNKTNDDGDVKENAKK